MILKTGANYQSEGGYIEASINNGIITIVKNDDVLGGIIVIAMEDKCFDESTIKVVKSYASFLAEILP